MRCTSFAPMCFRTWAASCSPRVNSRMAARSVPVRSASFLSVILAHPTSNDLCYPLRVLIHQRPGLRDLLLVCGRGGELSCGGSRQCLLLDRLSCCRRRCTRQYG